MRAPSRADRDKVEVAKRVLASLEQACGEKVRVLHVQAGRRAKTGETVFRVHAALEKSPNVPALVVGAKADGQIIDLRQVEKEEGRDIFARTDIDIVRRKLRPAQVGAAPAIDPAQNLLVLRQGEMLTEVVSVTVPKVPGSDKLDAYFLADVTGSMTSVLDELQASSNAVLTSIRGSGADVGFGVGSYRDFPGMAALAFMPQQAITTNDADVTAAIAAWRAAGGGDLPEGQLFALDRIAEDSGGEIGWRPGARRVLVWFGDAPGHEPICTGLTGLPPITTASVSNKLQEAHILVIAISVNTGGLGTGLDGDPTVLAGDYVGTCGAAGGFPAQATTIADDTGGVHLTGIDTTAIVDTIIASVGSSSAMIGEVRLDPAGPSRRFIASISPPEYGPLAGNVDHTLEFTLQFVGNVQCTEEAQVFEGQIAVEVDGVFIASKRLQVTVPGCADQPAPPPDPVMPPLEYELGSSPSAVAIQPGRAPSGGWEISVLARGSGGELLRAFNVGDPEDPAAWKVEALPRPGGPGGTRISFAPFALRTTESSIDQSYDFVHGLATGTDADLHEIIHSPRAAWMSWTDHGDPRAALAEAPGAAAVRRQFFHSDDDSFLADSDDQVFTFIWGDDGRLWRFHQGWHAHGNPAPGVDVGGPPSALYPQSPGVVRAFAYVIGNDRQLYVNRSVDVQLSSWTWHALGQPAPGVGVYFLRRPALVTFREPNAQGSQRYMINAIAPAEDRGLWDCQWEGPAWNNTIPAPTWLNLGRPDPAVSIRGSASAVVHNDGMTDRIYAFIVGTDGNLWVNIRAAGGGGAWTNLGKPAGTDLRGDPSAVVATPAGSDPLYVFLRGSDDRLHFCHLTAVGGGATWNVI